MGPDFDVGFAPSGKLSDFFNAAFFKVQQGDNGAVFFVKLAKQMVNDLPGFFSATVGKVGFFRFKEACGLSSQDFVFASFSVFPEKIVAGSNDDFHTPMLEGGVFAKSGQSFPDF
jgi:hypothetical protein